MSEGSEVSLAVSSLPILKSPDSPRARTRDVLLDAVVGDLARVSHGGANRLPMRLRGVTQASRVSAGRVR